MAVGQKQAAVWFQADQRSAGIPYRRIPSHFEPCFLCWLSNAPPPENRLSASALASFSVGLEVFRTRAGYVGGLRGVPINVCCLMCIIVSPKRRSLPTNIREQTPTNVFETFTCWQLLTRLYWSLSPNLHYLDLLWIRWLYVNVLWVCCRPIGFRFVRSTHRGATSSEKWRVQKIVPAARCRSEKVVEIFCAEWFTFSHVRKRKSSFAASWTTCAILFPLVTPTS